jgi:hypothetical protein
MLDNFVINLFIQLAIIDEHSVHLLQFLDNEVTFTNHGLYRDPATDKLLVYCHELGQLFVVDQVLELFYFVLEAYHSINLLLLLYIHTSYKTLSFCVSITNKGLAIWNQKRRRLDVVFTLLFVTPLV